MFEKILVATDLSPASDAVINCVSDLKSIGCEEVILFYACGVRYLDPLVELVKQSVESSLLKQQKLLEAQGFKTTLEIAPGIPSEELKYAVKKHEVPLIVIGTHGESAASHLLFRFGEVTSEVLHSHEKPLLLIRIKVTERNGERKSEALYRTITDKILFTIDFSDISMKAFLYVEKLVEAGCKQVTLLHVQDKIRIEKYLSDRLSEFNQIDTERLEEHKQQLIKKGAENVEIKIMYGIPSEEILKECRNEYSLIVMGSQGRGFFHELFIGSVSHCVARNVNTTLLLIPADNR